MTKILVVDDDQDIADMIAEKLGVVENWEICKAYTRSDAAKYMTENKVDILILDVVMTGMSHHEVLDIAVRSNSKIGVNVISGYSFQVTPLGIYPFFNKPIDFAELIASVKRQLEEQKEVDDTPFFLCLALGFIAFLVYFFSK